MPLERKQEQKLWEAFRQPIDEAFSRKSSEREKASTALNAHDQRVLEASQAVDAASASGDAQQIRSAMAALEAALRGQAEAAAAPATPAAAPAVANAAPTADTPALAADETLAVSGNMVDAAEAASVEAPAPAPAAATPPKKIVAVRGDDRPGLKKAEPAGRDERRGPGGRDNRSGDSRGAPAWGNRDERGPRGGDRFDTREARGPRLGDAAFRAQRQAIEHAEAALRKLAAQAHGEVLTQLMSAWQQRDAAHLPNAQTLGGRVNTATRSAWANSLGQPAVGAVPGEALLRLEMAAEVPTPAEQLSERRMLQLQLLTRRNAASPAETWGEDVARVLGAGFDEAAARRLQNVLKALLKR